MNKQLVNQVRSRDKACVVTGRAIASLLEVAHLRPYAKHADTAGVQSRENAILLTVDLHKLFDRNQIWLVSTIAGVRLYIANDPELRADLAARYQLQTGQLVPNFPTECLRNLRARAIREHFYELVCADSFVLWFPEGIKEDTLVVKDYDEKSDLVLDYIKPMLPSCASRIRARAICINPANHDQTLTWNLDDRLKDGRDSFELWTSHPIGWSFRTPGAAFAAGYLVDGLPVYNPWVYDPDRGTDLVFDRSYPLFHNFPGYGKPLNPHHWCVLVTYRHEIPTASPMEVSDDDDDDDDESCSDDECTCP